MDRPATSLMSQTTTRSPIRNRSIRKLHKRGKMYPGTEQYFSGTLGGPIVRDKTFFFVAWQEQRQRSTSQVNLTTLSAAGKAKLRSVFPPGKSANADLIFERDQRRQCHRSIFKHRSRRRSCHWRGPRDPSKQEWACSPFRKNSMIVRPFGRSIITSAIVTFSVSVTATKTRPHRSSQRISPDFKPAVSTNITPPFLTETHVFSPVADE